MNNEETFSFRDLLLTIDEKSPRAWVYLPRDANWSLDTRSAVLESDEVPPDLEDDPDAGIPDFAKRHNLVQVVPVSTLQDIIINVRSQKPEATVEELFRAFEYYYNNDAFLKLE